MSSDTTKPDPYPTRKLPLFSIPPPYHSHSHSNLPSTGTSTPPLQTTASVPFQWEEQPGKPRPCTDIILSSTNTHHTKCLHLPPRLLNTVDPTIINNKTFSHSPTTVFDGPGERESGGKLFFSSFRFGTERRRRRRSFDSDGDGQKRLLLGEKDDGKFKCKVTSSKMRKKSSVWKVTGSRVWAKVYEGLKQVVPWRKKPKIECFSL